VQCIQLEEQYGMQGVTRIPDKYKDKFKDKETEIDSPRKKKKTGI
jgi:hypothetical protein